MTISRLIMSARTCFFAMAFTTFGVISTGAQAGPGQEFIDAVGTLDANRLTTMVSRYYDLNKSRPTRKYGCNWYRVLVSFGDRDGSDWAGRGTNVTCGKITTGTKLNPVTTSGNARPDIPYSADEAKYSETVWSGWKPVRIALEKLESHRQAIQTCPTGQTGTPPNCVTPPPAKPSVSIAGGPNIFEGETRSGRETHAVFTISATGIQSPLTVRYTIGQNSYTKQVGQKSHTFHGDGDHVVRLEIDDDDVDEQIGYVRVNIDRSADYIVETGKGSTTVEVWDDDAPPTDTVSNSAYAACMRDNPGVTPKGEVKYTLPNVVTVETSAWPRNRLPKTAPYGSRSKGESQFPASRSQFAAWVRTDLLKTETGRDFYVEGDTVKIRFYVKNYNPAYPNRDDNYGEPETGYLCSKSGLSYRKDSKFVNGWKYGPGTSYWTTHKASIDADPDFLKAERIKAHAVDKENLIELSGGYGVPMNQHWLSFKPGGSRGIAVNGPKSVYFAPGTLYVDWETTVGTDCTKIGELYNDPRDLVTVDGQTGYARSRYCLRPDETGYVRLYDFAVSGNGAKWVGEDGQATEVRVPVFAKVRQHVWNLTLETPSEIVEGKSATIRIATTATLTHPLDVKLKVKAIKGPYSNHPEEIETDVTVTIPVGGSSGTYTIATDDDTDVEHDVKYEVRVDDPGIMLSQGKDGVEFLVTDNDTPQEDVIEMGYVVTSFDAHGSFRASDDFSAPTTVSMANGGQIVIDEKPYPETVCEVHNNKRTCLGHSESDLENRDKVVYIFAKRKTSNTYPYVTKSRVEVAVKGVAKGHGEAAKGGRNGDYTVYGMNHDLLCSDSKQAAGICDNSPGNRRYAAYTSDFMNGYDSYGSNDWITDIPGNRVWFEGPQGGGTEWTPILKIVVRSDKDDEYHEYVNVSFDSSAVWTANVGTRKVTHTTKMKGSLEIKIPGSGDAPEPPPPPPPPPPPDAIVAQVEDLTVKEAEDSGTFSTMTSGKVSLTGLPLNVYGCFRATVRPDPSAFGNPGAGKATFGHRSHGGDFHFGRTYKGFDWTTYTATYTYVMPEIEHCVRNGNLSKAADVSFQIFIQNDYHDEGTETAVLTLHNARFEPDDPSSPTISISTMDGTLTIENTDPIPRDHLAHAGHSLASGVADAISARVASARKFDLSVSGDRITDVNVVTQEGWSIWAKTEKGTWGSQDLAGDSRRVLLGADLDGGNGRLLGVMAVKDDADSVQEDYRIETDMLAVVPWVSINGIWAAAGAGRGELLLDHKNLPDRPVDADWLFLGVGFTEDSFHGDAFWQRMSSDQSRQLSAADAETWRARLGYRTTVDLTDALSLHPHLSLYREGGDIPSDFGFDAGMGMSWDHGAWSVHADSAYDGTDVSLSGAVTYRWRKSTVTVSDQGIAAEWRHAF